ncbi:MAG: catalase-related domain-containing protein, partial [Chthoniobacterales bacterium]
GCPMQAKENMGGFVSYAEKMQGAKVRGKTDKFFDHFSQAALFFQSQAPHEQQHIINALTFELGMVTRPAIVERMLGMLNKVDKTLASGIAEGLGMKVPSSVEGRTNQAVGADAGRNTESKPMKNTYGKSPALSMMNTVKNTIATRKIAILVAAGVDDNDLSAMKNALTKEGAMVKVIAPRGGTLKTAKGAELKVDMSLVNAASVLVDAAYVPGGEKSAATLAADDRAILFVNETFKHCKALAATGAGVELLRASSIDLDVAKGDPALFADDKSDAKKISAKFIKAIAQHRNWDRETKANIPA